IEFFRSSERWGARRRRTEEAGSALAHHQPGFLLCSMKNCPASCETPHFRAALDRARSGMSFLLSRLIPKAGTWKVRPAYWQARYSSCHRTGTRPLFRAYPSFATERLASKLTESHATTLCFVMQAVDRRLVCPPHQSQNRKRI